MKPVEGNFSDNVLQHGTGVLNTDACRIAINAGESLGGGMVSKGRPKRRHGWDRPWMHVEAVQEEKKLEYADKVAKAEQMGRFPPNVILDGSENINAIFPDSKSCNSPSKAKPEGTIFGGSRTQGTIYPGENGSAARFFYSAGLFDEQSVAKIPCVCRIDELPLEQLELDFPQ